MSAQIAGFDVTVTNDTPISNETIEEKTVENELAEDDVLVPAITESFTLIGRPELEQFFNDNIIDIVLHQEQYKRMGISFPGATSLYGPPGCGKTYAVEKLLLGVLVEIEAIAYKAE